MVSLKTEAKYLAHVESTTCRSLSMCDLQEGHNPSCRAFFKGGWYVLLSGTEKVKEVHFQTKPTSLFCTCVMLSMETDKL